MCAMTLPRSLRVRDFMSTSVLTLRPDMDVLAAMRVLLSRRISGAPVVDRHGSLVGMLTERDCLETLVISGYHDEREAGCVDEYMSREVATVEADTDVLSLAQRFMTVVYRRYPVIEEGQVVGIISRRDVLRAIIEHV